jgi:hypothetical protein
MRTCAYWVHTRSSPAQIVRPLPSSIYIHVRSFSGFLIAHIYPYSFAVIWLHISNVELQLRNLSCCSLNFQIFMSISWHVRFSEKSNSDLSSLICLFAGFCLFLRSVHVLAVYVIDFFSGVRMALRSILWRNARLLSKKLLPHAGWFFDSALPALTQCSRIDFEIVVAEGNLNANWLWVYRHFWFWSVGSWKAPAISDEIGPRNF